VKVLAAIAVALLIGVGAALTWLWAPWDEGGGDSVELDALAEEFRGSGCRRLAGIAADLAEADPEPSRFLRALGREAAGIRPPPRAFTDLARGGSDRIPGRGFLARFDDGSLGQARHFAGIAVARSFGSAADVRRISIDLRRDPADSPDGRLTDEAIEFANAVLGGDLSVAETPEWMLDNLCRRR
jgi:hypothetical protein